MYSIKENGELDTSIQCNGYINRESCVMETVETNMELLYEFYLLKEKNHDY